MVHLLWTGQSRKRCRLRRIGVNPVVEDLETRILLYSDLGDQWTYSSRITYSLIPDGTSVGGVPSALFSTLNANYPTATWEAQIEQAASLWEGATNANLALVSDGGQPVGSSGAQQDDPRFGDIRIGAVPLGSGILAETFLPPPANGGTDAGDILLNSNINWKIGSNYDLLTVAAHEFGHALGLGESSVSTAVMYGTYNGIKNVLASDDIIGIDSIYGTHQYDPFNSNGARNNIYENATNITSYISSNQIAIPGLDNTTTGDSEWYYVTVPSTTTGAMGVTVQSTNLSSFSPKLQIYSSALSLVGQTSAPNSFGATISLSTSVAAGQSYYVKVLAAGGAGAVGGYGLIVNFGNQPTPTIQPPNTYVASQPDQQGGAVNNAVTALSLGLNGNLNDVNNVAIGSVSGWAIGFGVSQILGPDVVNSPLPGTHLQTTSPNGSGASVLSTAWPSQTNASSSDPMTTVTTGGSKPLASVPTDVAIGPNIAVLQAVDEAIANWSSTSRHGRIIG